MWVKAPQFLSQKCILKFTLKVFYSFQFSPLKAVQKYYPKCTLIMHKFPLKNSVQLDDYHSMFRLLKMLRDSPQKKEMNLWFSNPFFHPKSRKIAHPKKGAIWGRLTPHFPSKNITQRYPSKCATIIPLSAPQEGSTWMVFYPISPHKLSLKVTPKIRPNSSSKSGQISL